MNAEKVNVIVGGGLSSMMIAKMIKKYKNPNAKIIIVEKDSKIGGQFGSTDYGEQGYFDFGMHIYYDSCIAEIDSLFTSILSDDEWNIMEGNYKDAAGIFWNGKLQTDFPYPDLRTAPIEKKKEYISDLFLNIEETKNKKLPANANAYEILKHHFGTLITDEIFVPILEKLYHNHPSNLAEMATLITKIDRVALFEENVILDFMKSPEIQSRICFTNQYTLPVKRNNSQRAIYPKKYGMFRALEKLKHSLEQDGVIFFTSTAVSDLKIDKKNITSLSISNENEIIEFTEIENVYWTAGLPSLSSALKLDLSHLKFDKQLNKAYYINFLFEKEPQMDKLYYFHCFDKGFRTFRVTNYFNYCKTANENRGYPVCVEFWANEIDPKEDDEIINLALKELKMFGVINEDNNVLFSVANKEHGAGFPLPTIQNVNNMTEVREKINAEQIKNLIPTGVHSSKNVFFVFEVLIDAYKKVIQIN